MKRFLSILLTISLFLAASTVSAEDIGIQIIGEDNDLSGSAEDMVIGKPITIDGFADVTLDSIKLIEIIGVYEDGTEEIVSSVAISAKITILNRNIEPINLQDCIDTTKIVATYDDMYSFIGDFKVDCVVEMSDGHVRSGTVPFRSKNDERELYDEEDAESYKEFINKGQMLIKDSMIVEPLYDSEYTMFFVVPPFVFDNDLPLSISFEIGQTLFSYSGRIEREQIRCNMSE